MSSKRGKKGTSKGNEANRRFAGNVSLGIVLAGTFVALVMVANRYGDAEPLSHVAVIGASALDTDEVVAHLELADSMEVARLDLADLEARLLDHPFVKGATAWDGGDGRLVLEIEERAPKGVVVLDGRPVYLDDRAHPLPFRYGIAQDVPVLTGIETSGEDSPFDSTLAIEALDLMATIEAIDPGLARMVGTLERDATGEYRMLLTERSLPVVIGDADGIIPRMRKLRVFVDHVLASEGSATITAVDVRWRGQVVVRRRAPTPPPVEEEQV